MAEGERVRPARGGRRPAERICGSMLATGRSQRRPGRSRSPGVPKQVRLEVTKRFEEDDGKRGGRENYFDLIHYRKIVTDNWELLSEIFAYGKKGVGKDKGTLWMEELNEKRRCVAHSSSGVSLSIEDLNQVQEYDDWLRRQIAGGNASASADESIEPESSTGS